MSIDQTFSFQLKKLGKFFFVETDEFSINREAIINVKAEFYKRSSGRNVLAAYAHKPSI